MKNLLDCDEDLLVVDESAYRDLSLYGWCRILRVIECYYRCLVLNKNETIMLIVVGDFFTGSSCWRRFINY